MVTLEFKGLQEIIAKLESIGQGEAVANVEKKIITEASEQAKKSIHDHFQASKDHSKSGRKGYRPNGGHFRDNIPVSNIRKGSKGYYLIIGDKKGDGDYWYSKFPNFGTSKQPPNHAFEFGYEAAKKVLDEQGIKQFEELLQKALD